MEFTPKPWIIASLLILVHLRIAACLSCTRESRGVVSAPSITEASGLCRSRKHDDIVYTHNDSGDGPKLYAVKASTAEVVATYSIPQASHGDWEDMACQGGKIYIANLGSHASDKKIYLIDEPTLLQDATLPMMGSKQIDWSVEDCETLMVAPGGAIYLVPKVHFSLASLYVVPDGPWDGSVVQPENKGLIKGLLSLLNGPVGGDISEDGEEVLIKSYGAVFHWRVRGSIEGTLTSWMNLPEKLDYVKENQGEAVCFDRVSHRFFTLSEGSNQSLFHYQCS